MKGKQLDVVAAETSVGKEQAQGTTLTNHVANQNQNKGWGGQAVQC